MRMGNFMCPRRIVGIVMVATEPRFGIRHLTVVPTNFERSDQSADVLTDENA